ncbi:hypothetical protein ACE10X_22830 [Bradyrhizobium sp. Pha-3]|uniref:hypothetical protein n=1 Tax=Bradyrhizobium sp. Pha-3 TaxID=208375 RepID=UPI0035D46766
MNRTVWAIAALSFVAGVLVTVIAQQSLHLFVLKQASADTAAQLAAASPAPAQPAERPTADPAAESFPEARRACTLKSAEALPKIAGLTIKATRTRTIEVSAQKWSEPVPPIRVEVDIVAAGQAATYAYFCGYSSVGALIQRLAN